jgi:hypothetical protein
MRYLLLIYSEEVDFATVDPADVQTEMDAYNAFTDEIRASGANLGGEALEPTSTATTVRVRDGQVQTTDGPFAETKEALGGYYLIEAKDLDEAIGWAAKIPGALRGSIEVRPIWEFGAAAGAQPEPAGAVAGGS